MALIHSLEKNGNFLFRYRGQFPVLLFLLAIPVVFLTDYGFLESNSTFNTIFTSFAIFISFIGQYIRSVAIGTSHKSTSGRNKHEQIADALNTKGIYSTVRHPLYLGNYFMWIGIIIYTFNFWFFLISSLMFWIYYERIMFAEERFLEKKFGDMYLDWSLKVPAFIPSFKNYIKPDYPFSFKTSLRREYSGVTATIIGFVFVDFLRNIFDKNWIGLTKNQIILLVIALLISLILRTLKHKTKLLHEEDRT